MKAMILAAGTSTRLYPLTHAIPKPMVPVVNRPSLEHIILHLKKYGFHELVVNLHYLPHFIEQCLGDGSRFGVKIHYSKEEKLLGTAGSVKKMATLFDETFLVIGGDDISDMNLEDLLRLHKEKSALATIGLTRVEDPTRYGVVVTSPRNEIIRFVEKPKGKEVFSNLVNTGIYIFEPEVLDMIPDQEHYDFGRQLFPRFLEEKIPFYGLSLPGYWCDVGDLGAYRQAHWDILYRRARLDIPGKKLRGRIWSEDGVLPDHVLAESPLLIGKHCTFGKDVKLIGPCVLGAGIEIGPGSVVRETILWDRVRIGEGARLDHCIIGADCEIEKGAILEGAVNRSGQKVGVS
ncbi:MAG: NDP-sugar synthase [Armatimonadetes bacterium]|nr:NDP-sugar synthase [Armatimonadota bacterium]